MRVCRSRLRPAIFIPSFSALTLVSSDTELNAAATAEGLPFEDVIRERSALDENWRQWLERARTQAARIERLSGKGLSALEGRRFIARGETPGREAPGRPPSHPEPGTGDRSP